jgi:2,4-dienoyl-CoA reductase-like NADH-dependent reductase (Old Yellow Enzyme family)
VSGFEKLFSPFPLRGRTLANRLVCVAHTTSMGQDGLPADRVRDYYVERARGGVAMIVMEPVPVHETARLTVANFVDGDDGLVAPLALLADAVHEHGTVIVSQLYHVGAHASSLASMRERWAPGPHAGDGPDRTHAVTRAEIAEAVRSFASTGARALEAGVDGVEVLMAHGGLIGSFFSETQNRRTDEYGGTFENRIRFAGEVLESTRAAIGPEAILGITLSGDHFHAGEPGGEECAAIAAALARASDIDYVAVGNGSYHAFEMIIPPMDVELGVGIPFARRVKEALPGTAVVAEGRITTPELGERALAEGACDLVGMARALIADPELPDKARTGRLGEIRPCIGCNQQCWGRRSQQFFISCLQNPAVGLEGRYGGRKLRRTVTPRRVVVAGGGPAGLEAARVAAERGHDVSLLEREAQLGGQALLAARLPHHAEFLAVVTYRERELARLGVDVHLGVEATVPRVLELAPDSVLVATGSRPAPESRWDGPVLAAADVVGGIRIPDGPLVLVDEEGHRKALGTAELLASEGRAVTLVTRAASVGRPLEAIGVLPGQLRRLAAAGVRLETLSEVEGFDGESALVRSIYDGRRQRIPAAVLVVAAPHVADDALVEPLRAAGLEAVVIGDALAPRLIDAAIRDGSRAAWELA